MPTISKLRLKIRSIADHLASANYEEFEPGLRQGCVDYLQGVQQAFEPFEAREKKILMDPELNDHGRQVRMAGLLDELLLETRDFFTKLEQLSEQHDTLGKSLLALPPAPTGIDPVIAELREQEIRAYLRSLSESERMLAYSEAVKAGNAFLIRAVRNSPFSLVELDYQLRVDREHSEETKPKEWRRLVSLDQYRRTVRQVANLALQEFVSSGVLPEFKEPPVGEAGKKYGLWYSYAQAGKSQPAKVA